MKITSILLLLLLNACGDPGFAFRGYGDGSTCADVIDAEENLGAKYESHRTEDLGNLGLVNVTRMNTRLFNVAMIVDIGCREDGEVLGIWYMAEPTSFDRQTALYDFLSRHLRKAFGDPRGGQSSFGRTSEFRCDDNGILILSDGIEDWEDREYEVAIYVEVGPRACGLY